MGMLWQNATPPLPPMRFAELYASAVGRLADAAPVHRVGALHTLESLGQAHPAGRPAIVDVLCAYLRTPPPAGTTEDDPVRATAQQILAAHLRPGGPGFWPKMSLDLTGAILCDFDLSGCRIDGQLILDNAVLFGPAKFRRLIVGGAMGLRHATLHEHAWLERADFHGAFRAGWATFHADAWFGETNFAQGASFVGTTFAGHAWFAGCTSPARVDFAQAMFRRSAGFRGASLAEVGLAETTFVGPARVSRRGEAWNVASPGWTVVTDPDNEAVGQLQWFGRAELVEQTPA